MFVEVYLFAAYGDCMDFAKIVSDAQRVPSGPPNQPPEMNDLFGVPAEKEVPVVELPDDPDQIEGVTTYPFTYHCQRFFIGLERDGVDDDGNKSYTQNDDGPAYRAVMEKVLGGKALIAQRKDSITPNGSVVIWLEWMEKDVVSLKKKARTGTQSDRLSLAELKSPERNTPLSKERDEEEAKGKRKKKPKSEISVAEHAAEEEEEGQDHEDEPPWR